MAPSKEYESPLTGHLPEERYRGPSELSTRGTVALVVTCLGVVSTIGMIVQTPDKQPVLVKVSDLMRDRAGELTRQGVSIVTAFAFSRDNSVKQGTERIKATNSRVK